MAQLGSPGVAVNVIDESFYNPATPGTVPLVVVATAQDKQNPSATGIAPGTTVGNAGKLYLVTSQRDLTDKFGTPTFQKDTNNNVLQGSELNEYGLFAAYSFLAASSSAYILRANVDLGALTAKSSVPTGEASNGTYWFDLTNSRYGVFEWDAGTQEFVQKTLKVVSDATQILTTGPARTLNGPIASFGAKGDYAVVVGVDDNAIWYKNSDANWVKVGSKGDTVEPGNVATFNSLDWATSFPVVSTSALTGTIPAGDFQYSINEAPLTTVSFGGGTAAQLAASMNNLMTGVAVKLQGSIIEFYTLDGGSLTVSAPVAPATNLLSAIGVTAKKYNAPALQQSSHTKVPFWKTNDSTTVTLTGGSFVSGETYIIQSLGTTDWLAVEGLAGPKTYAVGTPINAVNAGNGTGIVSKSEQTESPSGSVWIKTSEPNGGALYTLKAYSTDTKVWQTVAAPQYKGFNEALYNMDSVSGGTGIAVGKVFVNADYQATGVADGKFYIRANAGSTTVVAGQPAATFTGSDTFIIAETIPGSVAVNKVDFTMPTAQVGVDITGEDFITLVNNSALNYVTASISSTGVITLAHTAGGEIYMTETASSTALLDAGFRNAGGDPIGTNMYFAPAGDLTFGTQGYRASNFKELTAYASSLGGYTAATSAPTSSPADGTLWFSGFQDQVDIMVHNGTAWSGLNNVFPNAQVYVSATAPGKSGRVAGDIWVDTADQDAYGTKIYRWNVSALVWDPINIADHTSSNGIIFADARWGARGSDATAGTIAELRASDYVDPDAPDSTQYPRGMLLWNTRRSGFNIKQYRKGYIDITANDGRNPRFSPASGSLVTAGVPGMPGDPMNGQNGATAYVTDKWVSVSGSDVTTQAAFFGRKAQRNYVVGQMKAVLLSNQEILDEDNTYFNLIAAPGYPELIVNMVDLNNSRGGQALVVGDTPLRLPNDANSLVNYGQDAANSGVDGEAGLHTQDDHLAVFYPSGLTTDLSGSNVVVPPSHMMLRTIAISDQKAYQWFAPAGTRRGGITNASSVGYLKDGSFVPVTLNQGTRDQMATIKVNPITNIPGAGLVNFGQYTRSPINSSLDRINVARLVSYLRRQLGIVAKPFIFEPNDKTTRSEIKSVIESLMLDLVSLRAIYDFIVVCDETNNTSSIIANNQLYVDVAIEPVKAVEFIYIPLRLKNVGDIKKGA